MSDQPSPRQRRRPASAAGSASPARSGCRARRRWPRSRPCTCAVQADVPEARAEGQQQAGAQQQQRDRARDRAVERRPRASAERRRRGPPRSTSSGFWPRSRARTGAEDEQRRRPGRAGRARPGPARRRRRQPHRPDAAAGVDVDDISRPTRSRVASARSSTATSRPRLMTAIRSQRSASARSLVIQTTAAPRSRWANSSCGELLRSSAGRGRG